MGIDDILLKFLSDGGPTALAGIIFFFHRQDTQSWNRELKEIKDRSDTRESALVTALTGNTEALTRLATMLESKQAQNGQYQSEMRAKADELLKAAAKATKPSAGR